MNCDADNREVAVCTVDKNSKSKENRKNNRHRNKKFTGTWNNCSQHYHEEKDYQALEKNA